jgi:DNA-binding IclR family transcriptional regulator
MSETTEDVLDSDAADLSPGSAIAKAFRLLDMIVKSPQPISLNDLAARSAMPKASAHRMLLQLEAIGIVKRDVLGKRFSPGDDLAALAIDVIGALAKMPPVREIMQGLVNELGESCNLGILDGKDVLYLERIECDRPLRMHLRAGSRVPLHCTAVGKLVLAYMPERKARHLLEASGLPRFTENTITDMDVLIAQLGEIRHSGVSLNREEFTKGLIGAAVPVRSPHGAFVAGLAVHAPIFRMSVDQARVEAVPKLLRAAERISAEMALG